MCSREDDPTQNDHSGPYHELIDKRSLAIHLSGVWHRGPEGHYHRLASPGVAILSRWKLDDLREEHRKFHEGERPWMATDTDRNLGGNQ